MSIVNLSPAYVWDCEDCGRENFQRAVSLKLDPRDDGDAETIRRMHGLSEGEPIPPTLGVGMMTRPNRVTCKHCGTEFEAADSGSEDCSDDGEDFLSDDTP
ncbi:MAG TPA: hypothetical protein VM529_16300 [Gemmata sp.]|nr:hypothetical protein [Gemmata sp.]